MRIECVEARRDAFIVSACTRPAYLEDDLPELAAPDDVDEEVDRRVDGQEKVRDVDDIFNGPIAPARSPPFLVAALKHLVRVWDYLDALAQDEDGDDGDQNAGQLDLLVVHRHYAERKDRALKAILLCTMASSNHQLCERKRQEVTLMT